ncbi:cellobiose 2-epimerase [Adhaeribacter aerolatus]|uniref:Cellobiose 2-epimerase n=1 Tax=Adhaeribacter aerolatus TaxID=670289 RepID=A0A512AZ67_9BACT|nr:AGE family epimerase/isomerase [Adhaeribacter aerolatus]GEO05012.1 cellobiose 2-epimerase [Adhaeribacter aerolatus]
MKRIYFVSGTILMLAVLGLFSFKLIWQDNRAALAASLDKSIRTEMLNKWYPQAVDKEYGGFLSTFTYDFKPTGDQDKMIVTQARHTWSNAKAAILYPEVEHYKISAAHGFAFLKNVMWDKTYGGFYTLVDRQGNVKKGSFAPKEAYGNAFGIYALAAYYQASGDTSALNLAQKAFGWLEKNSHDPVYKGYFQHLERDGQPIRRTKEVPSTSDLGYKDQNSSIHLLEAFTELYQVWPNPLLRQRLQEMLYLIRDKITAPPGYLILFLQPNWQPVSFRDSSEAVILKHRNLDHVSFGHDVETAYLMLEASHVLGMKDDVTTMTVAKRMVDHALRHGWDNQVGGFYDEGYYYKGNPKLTIIRDTKNWWAQAEGLNTLLLMADHYPKESMDYFGKFQTLWRYIDKYLIDHEHGDWYPGGLDKEPQLKTALKGQIWKGNYHQFRSLANCVQRLQADKVPPSVPGKLTANTQNNKLVLTWEAARDNKTMLGYHIYQSGQRIGFTPLTSFTISGSKNLKGRKLSVRAVDWQGNLSVAADQVVL